MRKALLSTTFLGAALLATAGCRMSEEPAHASDGGGTAAAPAEKTTLAASSQPAVPPTQVPADVGREAPSFALADLDGVEHSLPTLLEQGKIVVLEWFNPDCPFTRAYHQPERRMANLASELGDDVVWLAINSGAEGQQGAGLERNQRAAREFQLAYPLLLDPSGRVGKQYGAATTPHMYVITPAGRIIYEGAIDDSGGRGEASKNYVAAALAEYRAGKPVTDSKTRAFGCPVKYGR